MKEIHRVSFYGPIGVWIKNKLASLVVGPARYTRQLTAVPENEKEADK